MSSTEQDPRKKPEYSTHFFIFLGLLIVHGYAFGLGAPEAFENQEVGWWLLCCAGPVLAVDTYLVVELLRRIGRHMPIQTEHVDQDVEAVNQGLNQPVELDTSN